MNCFSLLFILAAITVHFKKVCPNGNPTSGQLELRLENFLQFAHGLISTEKLFLKKIRGNVWHLSAKMKEENEKKYLFYGISVAVHLGLDFYCAAEVVLDVIVGEKKIRTRKFRHFFNNSQPSMIFNEQIEELLEICLSSQSDVVVLSANVNTDPYPRNDILLVKENELDHGTPIKINKLFLALNSPFFHKLFFANQDASSSSSNSLSYEPIVQLDPPSIPLHFEQMILTLHLGDVFLNDKNIENILRVANRFLVEEIEGRCAKFLLGSNSKMTNLGRFRIAFNYGLTNTKHLILNRMSRGDFSDGKNFMELFSEMEMLSEEAKDELMHRYDLLFPDAPKDGMRKKQKIVDQFDDVQ
ncbi:hypothetical protein niasHT_035201 [Heterodera trifolii]|uniref:BTB domain-containing protein n=1 Tax=Heterodera trifolii TaxID=157864 RepID=A0ABD2IVJ3_9BILA